MDSGQQLVDHLERRADARAVSELVNHGGDRIQNRTRARKGFWASRGHHSQLPQRGLGRAAADGGVQIEQPRRGGLFGEAPRIVGRHRRRSDDDAARLHRARGGLAPEQRRLGLSRVDDDDQRDVGIGERIRGALGRPAAGRSELVRRDAIQIEAGDVDTALGDGLSHAEAHRSQADHTRLDSPGARHALCCSDPLAARNSSDRHCPDDSAVLSCCRWKRASVSAPNRGQRNVVGRDR